jgi:hypothetical protein
MHVPTGRRDRSLGIPPGPSTLESLARRGNDRMVPIRYHLAMDDLAELRRQLEELRSEHRDLDDVIRRLGERGPFDQLQIQRLKKRKLVLKDQIAQIESKLLPDIIA